ncbi:MAG: wax ester/triacylglycerol synthase family O-acyltransferase [Candidatus Nanopelagicales bacterium]
MARSAGSPTPVARLEGADRMQWESDVGPFPQHMVAVLFLEPSSAPAEEWARAMTQRLGGIPLLGRRPARPPFGGGPWVWLDDDRDPAGHVDVGRSEGADDAAMVDQAMALAAQPMPRGRSPWRARVLVGPDGAVRALVLVLHHALADGLNGLLLLGALVDGVPVSAPTSVTAPPDRAALARDAWSRRLRAARALPTLLPALRAGWQEMGGGRTPRAPRTPVTRPTGPRREVVALDLGLDAVRQAAHRDGATVTDVLLVAAASALDGVSERAGTPLPTVVVSVPVAVTGPGGQGTAGNAVGAIRMPVPTRGDPAARVRTVSALRRERLAATHGRSLPLVLASFRVLTTLGLVRFFLDHQRLVNTLVTSMRGPDHPLTILGTSVRRVVPVVVNQGNQTVSFAALGYAGTLTVSVITDPDAGPRAVEVARRLRVETDRILHPPG